MPPNTWWTKLSSGRRPLELRSKHTNKASASDAQWFQPPLLPRVWWAEASSVQISLSFSQDSVLPQSSLLFSPFVREGAIWSVVDKLAINHCPRVASYQGWRSAPKLHKTNLISNQGHSHRVSRILSKERGVSYETLQSTFQRRKKKRKTSSELQLPL